VVVDGGGEELAEDGEPSVWEEHDVGFGTGLVGGFTEAEAEGEPGGSDFLDFYTWLGWLVELCDRGVGEGGY
jgi:hypothetical protein